MFKLNITIIVSIGIIIAKKYSALFAVGIGATIFGLGLGAYLFFN